MKKLLITSMVFLFLLSCSNSVGPEDLNYVAVQYHEREIVDGEPMYYIQYYGGGVGAITYRAPEGSWWTGTKVTSGEDFTWQEKKYHCRTVKSEYIEVAAY